MNRYLCAIGWKEIVRIPNVVMLSGCRYVGCFAVELSIFLLHAINNNYQIMWRWCARKLCLTTVVVLYFESDWLCLVYEKPAIEFLFHGVYSARHLASLLTYSLKNLVTHAERVARDQLKYPIKMVIRDKNDVGNRNTISREPAPNHQIKRTKNRFGTINWS